MAKIPLVTLRYSPLRPSPSPIEKPPYPVWHMENSTLFSAFAFDMSTMQIHVRSAHSGSLTIRTDRPLRFAASTSFNVRMYCAKIAMACFARSPSSSAADRVYQVIFNGVNMILRGTLRSGNHGFLTYVTSGYRISQGRRPLLLLLSSLPMYPLRNLRKRHRLRRHLDFLRRFALFAV